MLNFEKFISNRLNAIQKRNNFDPKMGLKQVKNFPNAAANLHKRFRERSGAPQNPAPARKVYKVAELKKKSVDNTSASP